MTYSHDYSHDLQPWPTAMTSMQNKTAMKPEGSISNNYSTNCRRQYSATITLRQNMTVMTAWRSSTWQPLPPKEGNTLQLWPWGRTRQSWLSEGALTDSRKILPKAIQYSNDLQAELDSHNRLKDHHLTAYLLKKAVYYSHDLDPELHSHDHLKEEASEGCLFCLRPLYDTDVPIAGGDKRPRRPKQTWIPAGGGIYTWQPWPIGWSIPRVRQDKSPGLAPIYPAWGNGYHGEFILFPPHTWKASIITRGAGGGWGSLGSQEIDMLLLQCTWLDQRSTNICLLC